MTDFPAKFALPIIRHRSEAEDMPKENLSTEEIPVALVRLLHALEMSLSTSRRALVKLDLSSLQQETMAQNELARRLGLELCSAGASDYPERTKTRETPRNDRRDQPQPASSAPPSTPAEALRRSANRVRDAIRLQAALLSRAQNKLRAIRNLLRGRDAFYGPVADENFPAQAWSQNGAGTDR